MSTPAVKAIRIVRLRRYFTPKAPPIKVIRKVMATDNKTGVASMISLVLPYFLRLFNFASYSKSTQ